MSSHLKISLSASSLILHKNNLSSDVQPEMNFLMLSARVHDKEMAVRFLRSHGVIHQQYPYFTLLNKTKNTSFISPFYNLFWVAGINFLVGLIWKRSISLSDVISGGFGPLLSLVLIFSSAWSNNIEVVSYS